MTLPPLPGVGVVNEFVQVEIWSSDNPPVFLDTLPGCTRVSYLEELYGPGSGSITVPFTDDRVQNFPDLLAKRNIVRIRLNFVYRCAFIIQNSTATYIADGEFGGQVWEISGEGLRTWFNDAVLCAENPGYNTNTTLSDRNFNFASARASATWYDPDAWVTPHGQGNKGVKTVFKRGVRDYYGNPWIYFPKDFPDDDATWIWDRDTRDVAGAPSGTVYFRHEFDLAMGAATTIDLFGNVIPLGGEYTLFITADNSYVVYMDSMEVGRSSPSDSWRTLGTYQLNLAVGPHVLAVKCTNINKGGAHDSRTAGLLVAMYQEPTPVYNPDGTLIVYPDPSSVVKIQHLAFHSQNTSAWKMLAYPDVKPGWTMGEVVIKICHEAADRGVRAFTSDDNDGIMGIGFTRSLDSYGNPWDTRFEWTFTVGDSYSSLLTQFEAVAGDFWVDPATFNLCAYNTKGYDRTGDDSAGAGHPPDGKTSIYIAPGRNILESTEEQSADPKTSVLLMSKGRWNWVDNAVGTTKWGRIETFLSVGEQEQLFATKIANWTLAEKLIITKSAAITFLPDPETRPFEDFGLGDWILVESRADARAFKRRVVSIAFDMDENADVTWALELDTPEKTRVDLIERRIAALGMGGSSITPGVPGTISAVGNQIAVNKTVPISRVVEDAGPPPKPNMPAFSAPDGRPAVPGVLQSSYVSSAGVTRTQGTKSWYPPIEAVDESPVVITHFPLQVKDSPNAAWVALPDIAATPNNSGTGTVRLQQAQIQDLVPGKPYLFRMAAVSDQGVQSDWAAFSLSGTTDTEAPPQPSAPLLVGSVLSDTEGSVQITWDGTLLDGADFPDDFDHIGVYLWLTGADPAEVAGPNFIGQLTVAEPVMDWANLVRGEEYQVTFTAVDGNANASARGPVAFLTVETEPDRPSQPTVIGTSDGVVDPTTDASLQVTWDGVLLKPDASVYGSTSGEYGATFDHIAVFIYPPGVWTGTVDPEPAGSQDYFVGNLSGTDYFPTLTGVSGDTAAPLQRGVEYTVVLAMMGADSLVFGNPSDPTTFTVAPLSWFFYEDGVWERPEDLATDRYLVVSTLGAGGGGCGGPVTVGDHGSDGGGGGGGGGRSEETILVSDWATSVNVYVGVGGTGGTPVDGNPDGTAVPGTNGTLSAFGDVGDPARIVGGGGIGGHGAGTVTPEAPGGTGTYPGGTGGHGGRYTSIVEADQVGSGLIPGATPADASDGAGGGGGGGGAIEYVGTYAFPFDTRGWLAGDGGAGGASVATDRTSTGGPGGNGLGTPYTGATGNPALVNGQVGQAQIAADDPGTGGGGGGGGASSGGTYNGGDGADGGQFGAGGGGGGSGQLGALSGKGGDGSPGLVTVKLAPL